MNETAGPVPTQPPEDKILHDSADAAQRIFADYPADSQKLISEGGHLQGANDVMFDPAKRVTDGESRMLRKGLATAAVNQQKATRHADDLHTEIGKLHQQQQAQKESHARIAQRLRDETRIDLDTQARNKTAYLLEFPGLVTEATDEQQPLGILFADIDGLKRVNEKLSHSKGDEMLSLVGSELQRMVREDKDIIFRLGGDEFLIAMPDFKSHKDIPPDKFIDIRAQAIRETITRSFREAGLPVDQLGLGISIAGGILTPGEKPKEFVDRVDRDMLAAKAERKRLLKNNGINFEDDRVD